MNQSELFLFLQSEVSAAGRPTLEIDLQPVPGKRSHHFISGYTYYT